MDRPIRDPRQINNNARLTSNGKNVMPAKYKKTNINKIKGRVKAGVAALLVVFAISEVNEFKEGFDVYDFYQEEGYYNAIDDFTWVTTENGERIHGYNHDRVASWAKTSDDPEIALYSFYCKAVQNTNWNMSEVIQRMGVFGVSDEGYNSFNDYMKKSGFTSFGRADTDTYEEEMNKRVLALKEQKTGSKK